jgi:hypothetical protein
MIEAQGATQHLRDGRRQTDPNPEAGERAATHQTDAGAEASCEPALQFLRAAAAAQGCVAHRAGEQRAVHRFQMRQQSCNLRQERVGEDRRHFLVANAACVPDQLADIDIEGRS